MLARPDKVEAVTSSTLVLAGPVSSGVTRASPMLALQLPLHLALELLPTTHAPLY